jgi:hypothetical protein
MYVFGSEMKSRGCFFAIPLSLRFGKGARLQLPVGGQMPAKNVDQYLATDIRATQREKYYLLPCFNEATYTYAFGHDPTQSTASITFVGFMITSSGLRVSGVLNTFNQKYGGARLSRSKSLATITVGSNKLSGFVVGLDVGTADIQHNLQTFTVHLLLISAQGGGAGAGGGAAGGGGLGLGANSGGLTDFAGNAIGSNNQQFLGPGGAPLTIGAGLAASVANAGLSIMGSAGSPSAGIPGGASPKVQVF